AATLKIGSVKVDGEIGFFYCKGNENVTLPEIKWVAPNVLQGKESFSLPVLQAGQSSTTTVTVVGVSAGFDNYCSVVPAFSVDLNGLMMSAYVSAANTVTVRFVNPTSSSVGPLTGVLRATVQV
ncbi:MAG: hypothetical protein LWW92_14425, partial [Rhodocyclales bacterium]|nr:hypothetical protein [Rhodocyclales bacterium]